LVIGSFNSPKTAGTVRLPELQELESMPVLATTIEA